MALESFYIRVTHAGASAGAILLNDVDSGFDPLTTGARQRRPGAVYVPAGGSVDLALSSSVLHSYESGTIRQFVDAGELTVSLVGGVTQVLSFLYDFDSQGGAVGTLTLTGVDGEAKQLPAGSLVLRGWVEPITEFDSAGDGASATFGTTADPDGIKTTEAEATYTSGSLLEADGAQLHNATPVRFVVGTTTDVVMAIAGEALTAGKAYLHLEVLASLG